jgi:RNA polymerase sigma-54 factor
MYADILHRNRDEPAAARRPAAGGEVADQNVQQRFDLTRVAGYRGPAAAFLRAWQVAMRPLVLREIADTLGLHVHRFPRDNASSCSRHAESSS